MIRSLTVIVASAFAIGAGVAESADESQPAGSGHDTFVRLCSACHAPDLVTSKRLSREGWEEVVQMMIGRGATGTEAELAEIVEYLAATYPPRSTAAPLEQSSMSATSQASQRMSPPCSATSDERPHSAASAPSNSEMR